MDVDTIPPLNEVSQMATKKHQPDLFVCDLASWPVKDDMASMDVPIFSLQRYGDTKIRHYQRGNKSLTITPSVLGAATVFDKDLLLFVVSQIIEAKNKGLPISRTVKVDSYDYLVGTDRGDGRKSFEGIIDTLRRLKGTNLETNIATGDISQTHGFGLIEEYKILSEKKRIKKISGKKDTEVSRIMSFELTLSEWLMNGLTEFQVLTLDRDYFKLDKSIDRRIYEIAKWHCRDQPLWKLNIDLLAEKCGVIRERFKFRADIRSLIQRQPIPEYYVAMDTAVSPDMIVFYTKTTAELSRYLIAKDLIKWFETLERKKN